MITVILNCYKRIEYLKEQVEAIKNQTCPPEKIWIWVNKTEENSDYDFDSLGLDTVVYSDTNFKYHARFSLGLLADTEYVAFFDDDTIPGSKWFENCLNTMDTHPGILGGAGVQIQTNGMYPYKRQGWPVKNENTVEVDLVGHAWFMKREHLSYLWYEEPYSLDNGEDMQLSFLAQRYGDVKTYCPPHPVQDPQMSSSVKPHYGDDAKASYKGSVTSVPNFKKQRDDNVREFIKRGWNLINYVN